MPPGTVGKHAVGATEVKKRLLVVDELGYLVFPATVGSVDLAGKLHLKYDHDSARARSRSLTCSHESGCLGIRSS